jgi:MOSC domain-containing protein YiiM
VDHRTTAELLSGLGTVEGSPADRGTLVLIVRRPVPGERDLPTTAELRVEDGLVGDSWLERGSRHTEDGSPEPDRQITIANARALELFTDDRARWPLAGDQLYVDLDLSDENLPPGTRLQVGSAVLEVTAAPHTGCAKFADRFGMDVARFVNSPDGLRLRLRGINARVVVPGTIHVGDEVGKAGISGV